MGALPTIEPLAAPMGAVVHATDFAALTDEVVDHVRAALAQHQVLVFRDHDSPPDALLFAFASALGTVLIDNITPEFKRPGFLTSSDVHRLTKTGFHLDLGTALQVQQNAIESIHFGLPPPFACRVHYLRCFLERRTSLFELASLPIYVGQNAQKKRPPRQADGRARSQAVSHLHDSVLRLALCSTRPTAQQGRERRVHRKSVLRTREPADGFREILRRRRFTAKLMHHRSASQSKSQTVRIGQFLRRGKRLLAFLQSLIRVAEQPQVQRRVVCAKQLGADGIGEGAGARSLSKTISGRGLQVGKRRAELSKKKRRDAQRTMRFDEHS